MRKKGTVDIPKNAKRWPELEAIRSEALALRDLMSRLAGIANSTIEWESIALDMHTSRTIRGYDSAIRRQAMALIAKLEGLADNRVTQRETDGTEEDSQS